MSLRSYQCINNNMRGKQRSKLEKPVPVVEVLPATREEKLQYFLQKVESKVADLIDSAALTVANKKIPFSLPDRNEAQILSKQLEKVQQGKLLAHSQLKSVTEQQLNLRFQRRLLHPSNTHRPKSELTNEDISILAKLKKQYRDFERGLQEKTKAYEDFLQMAKKEKTQLEEQKRKEECQNKKREIAARLEVLEKQKAERQKQFQEQRRQLAEVRARKKLHEQWQKGQKDRDRLQMQEKVALMTSRLKQKTLDLQAIKEHEERYEELLVQQRTDRDKRRQEYGQKSRQRREDSFEKSKYYTIVLQQDRKRKQDQELKKKQRLQFLQAAKIYADQAQRDHSPRLKTHSSQQSKNIDRRQGLSFDEIKERGNGYMIQAKMAMRKDLIGVNTKSLKEKMDVKSVNQSEFERSSKTRYKDYLSERRMLRPKQEQDMRHTQDKIKDRLIRRNLEDVYKIMGSKGEKGDKLQRVKNIAQRLEVNGKGEEHLMIDKISAKLKILQTLSDCN